MANDVGALDPELQTIRLDKSVVRDTGVDKRNFEVYRDAIDYRPGVFYHPARKVGVVDQGPPAVSLAFTATDPRVSAATRCGHTHYVEGLRHFWKCEDVFEAEMGMDSTLMGDMGPEVDTSTLTLELTYAYVYPYWDKPDGLVEMQWTRGGQ
jgi:hypothetical protein